MADVQSNINVNIDTSNALASLKLLQRQISAFHTQMAKSGASASAVSANQAQNLMNAINATGKFQASMTTVASSTEHFTNALEKNKLSAREYFRYTGAATKTFGKLFKSEFDTISKVSRERVKDVQTQYIKMGRGANGAIQSIAVRPLVLDMKNLSTQTAMAAQKQQLLNQLLKQGSTNLLNFGKNTQWAGRQLMVGFTLPLAMLGATASKTFMQLEEQAIRFKRVYGELFTTTEETNEMVKNIRLLANEYTKYGVAVEDTMKMAADAAAMGEMGADLLAQVSQATRLAVLGAVEQDEALKTTISLTNAFGVATEDLTKKIDFLNAVENQTVVSIEDLTIAIPKAGPVVKQLGGDVEDLTFFLTAMKEGGINASEGANALKSGLASLINPAEKSAKFLAELGININSIVESNAGDVKSTVIDFANALDTLDPLNRARAIEQLFGKFQFSRLSTLFQNVVQEGNQASRVLELSLATTEELAILSERELGKIEETTTYKFKKSIEDLKVAIAPVGEAFLKALTPIVEFASKVLERFDNLGEGSKKFLTMLTVGLGVIGPVALMTFGLLANGVANIIKLFANMKSVYNKAGSSSQILGQQTSYLTQEQLEASAVAASLNQVHTTLKQTFTAETSAVNALALAYRNAIAAQVGFTGPVRGTPRSQATQKYSSGTKRVPGSGNQDTVPAMLTPGEAVIPAGVAQDPRFKPIISAMVDKRLQGFNGGTKAVVAYGAHQPFTTAHEDIANQGKALAGADKSGQTQFIQYTSEGTQAAKGVFSLESRLQQIKESTGTTPVTAKNPFAMMADLKEKGFSEVKILLGTDRVTKDVFDEAAKKYGIRLEKIEVPRVTGSKEDVSATRLRKALVDGDMETANRLLARGTSEKTKKLLFSQLAPSPKSFTYNGKEYTSKSPKGAQSIKNFLSGLIPNPDGTFTHLDEKNVLDSKTNLTKEKISAVLDKRQQENDLSWKKIQKSLGLGQYQYSGRSVGSSRPTEFEPVMEQAKKQNAKSMLAEKNIIEEELKKRNILLTENDKKSFGLNASHITEEKDANGKKIWRFANVTPDTGYINNYMNTIKGQLGQRLLRMSDAELAGLKTGPINRTNLERLVSGNHPMNPSEAETFRNIAKHQIATDPNNKTINKAHMVDIGVGHRLKTGTYGVGLQSLAQMFPDDPRVKLEKIGQVDQQEMKRIAAVSEKFTKNKELTKYDRQLAKTSGYSFTAAPIGGVYERDGKKFFVKPMMDLTGALAEMRGTKIAREVHGLDAPEQTIKTMLDPTDPKGKRRLIVLESPFDDRFDEKKIPRTFTKDEMIKQLVASGLRGDKDLKMGNLGGKVLSDVGTAGVFASATGARSYAQDMPSVYSMMEKNLQGVGKTTEFAGKSPFWFGNATADTAREMSSGAYADAIKKEISQSLVKLKQVIPTLGLSDIDRKPYQAMVDRLEAANNIPKSEWEALHKKHTSIVVKPDEKLQDIKTEKISELKTKSLPGNIKSDSGSPKDTRLAEKPKKGKKVVQDPATSSRRIIRRPGFAFAPEATGMINADSFQPSNEIIRGAKESVAQAREAGKEIGTTISTSASQSTIQNEKRLERTGRGRSFSPQGAPYQVVPGPMLGPNLPTAYDKTVGAAAGKVRNFVGGSRDRLAARRQERAALGKQSMGLTGGAMAASGVAMMASMVPGQVGNLAQKIMMPLMGISMILPMLQNKFTALAVGVGLVVAAYAYQKMAFDKAQNAALELTEAMNGGTKSTKNFAIFANKVSAGEIMQRRRQESFSPFQIQTGKTTFGQSFIAGEQGQAMAKNVTATFKASGKDVAQDQVVNQMATAVASGALTTAQARSVVANLAQELGDYSFGIKINGQLTELLGPNGENLLKDPIGVRVKILQNTRERMGISSEAARKAGEWTERDTSRSKGFTLAGAGLGAIGGAIAGGILGMIGGPAGSVAGAALGVKIGSVAGTALGGIAGNLFGRKERSQRIGEASGANVAMQKIALEQQQEMMDSLELEYQQKLEVANAARDQAEAERLTTKYIEDRKTLLTENLALTGDIAASFADSEGATRKALMSGADKAMAKQYKGTALEDVVPLAKTLIDDSVVDEEVQYTLKMQVASGQIDPLQMIELMQTFGKDKVAMENVMTIIGKFGGAFANQMMGIVGMFKDPKQSTKFIADIKTKTSAEAQKQLDLFQRIAQSNEVIGADVLLNYYNNNPKAAEDLQTSIAEIQKLKGKISLEVAATVLGDKEMALLKSDQEYFNSLPPLQQKTYLQNVKVIMAMEGDPAMMAQYSAWAAEVARSGVVGAGNTFEDFVKFKTGQVTASSGVEPDAPGSKVGGGTPAAKQVQSSPLDALLKRLKDVRNNTIKVTEGFAASSKALNKLFGGNKNITMFSGIENDIRKLGGSEGLIEMIVGMDPKEYEKQKNKLFKFDSKGNISGIKETAKSISKALASINLGEFVSQQQRVSREVQNQYIALNRLEKAGIDSSVALEAVADATFAAAIANKNLKPEQIKKLADEWKKTTNQVKDYNNLQSLISLQNKFAQDEKTLKQLSKSFSQYTQEEMDSVMSNPELQQSLVDGLSNPTNLAKFKTSLEQSLENVKVQMNLKKMTTEGMQDIFSNGMSAAAEAFSVQEESLRIKFEIDNKSLTDSIDQSQNQISALQFSVGLKEAGLKEIQDQEEKINEVYDARVEALDEVAKINSSIAEQQKGQLSLAEALTSGDIASAARVAQEIRSREAADAIRGQREAMERSRTLALENVKAKNGQTRKQLEAEIKGLQDEIYKLEQKLNQDEESLRLKELALEVDIKKITVLGQTRTEFESITNAIDLARIKGQAFLDVIRNALDVVTRLSKAYGDQTSNFTAFTPPPPKEEKKEITSPPPTETPPPATDAASALRKLTSGQTLTDAEKRLLGMSVAPTVIKETVNPTAPTTKVTVKSGDTLSSIAKSNKTTVSALIAANPKLTTDPKYNDGKTIFSGTKIAIPAPKSITSGGGANSMLFKSKGGLIPKYFTAGGFAKGTDTVPAMLTPGEFIMSKYAVDTHGLDTMKAINNGSSAGDSVYNYSISVNVKSDADANEIARSVMTQIKSIDSQRLRGTRI